MRPIPMSSAPVLLLLSAAFGFGLLAGIPRPVQAQQDVAVRITADNAYGFGYGKAGAMASYFGGIENGLARDIFSCSPDYGIEAYTVPAAAVDDYLYIVAWSDKAVTQGVIAEFKAAGRIVYTGIGEWQVYATGQDFRPPSAGPGPSLDEINRHIGLANAAAGDPATTSVGWRGLAGPGHGLPDALAFGEANDDSAGAGDFPALACLDPRARWMWYNSDSARFANPFRGGPSPAGHKEFLIFRLGVREVVATPTAGAPPGPRPSAR